MRYFILLLALSLVLFSCSDDDSDSSPVITPSTGSSEWLVMIYIAADNSLSSAAVDDIDEIKASSLNGAGVRTVVLVDQDGANDSYLYEIKSNGIVQLGSTELGLPASGKGEVDTGNPATLSNFIRFAKTTYEASNYALIIWNHGGGWRAPLVKGITTTKKTTPLTKDICWDDSSGSHLGNNDVQQIVRNNGIKLLAMDACLMGMVETAYEMRKSVTGIDYLVFSQQTEPGGGYPYTAIFNSFIAATDSSASNFARIIVDEYINHYGPATDLTQSAVDLSKIGNVVTALNSFVTYLETQTSNTLDAARANSTTFAYPTHVDLWGFADNFTDPSATALKNAIENAVIANRTGSGKAGAHGLSVFFTTVNHVSDYLDSNNTFSIDFIDDSTWDNFLSSRIFGYSIDSNEPANDSAGGFVAGPGVYTNYIIDSMDVDYFTVVVTGSGTLTAGLSNVAANVDYDMVLLNSSENVIGTFQSGSYGASESMNYPNAVPGTYHIVVYPYDGFSFSQFYTLTLGGTATY